jgi:multidrug efflux pump subunit AcrB
MWIVEIALRRPYTFVVLALAILLAGGLAVVRMPADIFPDIDIPVVSVVWQYNGLTPEIMSDVFATRSERGMTTTVNDIEHMESQTMQGVSIIRMYFHPGAKIEAAIAQIASQTAQQTGFMPDGARPPNVVRYNASSVPILQLGLSSESLSEQEVYDLGNNFLRTQLASIQGAAVPSPFGGKSRQVMVDLNPDALYARGLSPADVSAAISSQNVIMPSGTAKIGGREYRLEINNSPTAIEAFNRLPVRTVNGSTVYVRDVAQVHDGYTIQQNVVRHDGKRGALIPVLKNGGESTIDIVARVKQILPRIQSTLPAGLTISQLFDQSIFVRSAIQGVVREAIAAALLTGLMILLFLGSWRSTLIVCISIPLSCLTALAILYAMGETINIMTLGGLALAVGILVDDATVTIENIHRNIGMGKPLLTAILDGAAQISVPAFVSTLCICIVFVPVAFLSGTAKYLFTPLALAVVLAMAASYFLSRTLVPTMIHFLMPAEMRLHQAPGGEADIDDAGIIWHIHHLFQRAFDKFQDGYCRLLDSVLHHRWLVLAGFLVMAGASIMLYPRIGTDFFPLVDAGQIRLHVRTASGTRIEETEARIGEVEHAIRDMIPQNEVADILDNIGLPSVAFNLAWGDSATIGSSDGEILVSLKPEHHSTWDYVRRMRKELPEQFPGMTFFFQPADIVSQILNFGLPAPIDIQIAGPQRNAEKNYAVAQQMSRRLGQIPGTVDVHIHQLQDVPMMRMDVDRERANSLGFTQRDIASSTLISLNGTAQVGANYWINQSSGVTYNVVTQTPSRRMDSPDALLNTPLHTGTAAPQFLGNLAHLERHLTSAVVSHYNVQPVYDIYAGVQDRDLGGVSQDIQKVVAEYEKKLPRGSFIDVRGQTETMRTSFVGMGYGLIFAIILVYFVMVVNFQSWLDPFIILMALPGALTGILLFLFFSHTTISVPALMGAIMSIGVGTANSILLVTFANDLRKEGMDALTAAYESGRTRLRPVVMTAVAMLVGMIPMAMGLGEGGEQNAPLGRAVIGGLMLATVATLFVVPVVYSILRRKAPKDYGDLDTELHAAH